MKTCTSCGVEKPLGAFHKHMGTRDGRRSYCKPCACTKVRVWQLANLDRVKANQHCWYVANQARVKATTSRYYRKHTAHRKAQEMRRRKAHPEKRRASDKRYKANHREELRVWEARWRKMHPEQVRRNARHRRAQKRAIHENFTAPMEQFVHEFWGYQCAVCRTFEQLCVDHWLPLSKGYALTMNNAVLLCTSCNCKKSDRLPDAVYGQKFVRVMKQQLHKQARQWATRAKVA